MSGNYSDLSSAALLALDRDTAKQFFGHREDAARLTFVKELAAGDSLPKTLDVAKSWRALHACLGDGSLDPNSSEPPLGMCILGGRQMQTSGNEIVSLLRPDMVPAVATALSELEDSFVADRYAAIDQAWKESLPVADVQQSLADVTALYAAAASERSAVVFAAW